MTDKKWIELFESYNEELAIAYEEEMEKFSISDQINNLGAFAKIRNNASNNINEWYDISNQKLEGQTPKELIDEIKTPEYAISFLKVAFLQCDDQIPKYLSEKLVKFGDELFDEVGLMALRTSWEESKDLEALPSDSLFIASGAFRLLIEWDYKNIVGDAIKKLSETKVPNQFLIESIKEYLVYFDIESTKLLTDELNRICDNKLKFDVSHEYLLVALTLTGSKNKSDNVYMCIRNCFKYMSNKVIGAICVGDYNDARGIGLLKEYLLSNINSIKREEFYEMLSSIKRLGGKTDDIKDPFKDFSD